jgi:hypothetical protein
MENEVAHLAYRRRVVAEREALLIEEEAKLHASLLWQMVGARQRSLNQAKDKQADAETEVRKEALAAYEETGDKKPHPAVPIKMYTVLEYEEANALDYAREHLPKALKLVKRTFEKAAKVLELDFVTVTQEPRATIARDLSEYLPVG